MTGKKYVLALSALLLLCVPACKKNAENPAPADSANAEAKADGEAKPAEAKADGEAKPAEAKPDGEAKPAEAKTDDAKPAEAAEEEDESKLHPDWYDESGNLIPTAKLNGQKRLIDLKELAAINRYYNRYDAEKSGKFADKEKDLKLPFLKVDADKDLVRELSVFTKSDCRSAGKKNAPNGTKVELLYCVSGLDEDSVDPEAGYSSLWRARYSITSDMDEDILPYYISLTTPADNAARLYRVELANNKNDEVYTINDYKDLEIDAQIELYDVKQISFMDTTALVVRTASTLTQEAERECGSDMGCNTEVTLLTLNSHLFAGPKSRHVLDWLEVRANYTESFEDCEVVKDEDDNPVLDKDGKEKFIDKTKCPAVEYHDAGCGYLWVDADGYRTSEDSACL